MNRKFFSKSYFAIALTSVVMASCDNGSNQNDEPQLPSEKKSVLLQGLPP